MSIFNKKPKGEVRPESNREKVLNHVLLRFPNGKDTLTISEACEGCATLGTNGSGKTSGWGNFYMQSIFRDELQIGGVVNCVKKVCAKQTIALARQSGRKVIHFKKGSPYNFNFMEYHLAQTGDADGLADLFSQMSVMVGQYTGNGGQGRSEDQFWQLSMQRLINRSISLLVQSNVPVTVVNMRSVIVDSFSTEEVQSYNTMWMQMTNEKQSVKERNNIYETYMDWVNSNFFLNCLHRASKQEELTEAEHYDLELVSDYFMKEWPNLSSKTRSIVEESAMGLYECFLKGVLRQHFSQGVSEEILPQNSYKNGDIIVVDFSVKEFGLSGILANMIYRYCFQTTMERREISEEENPRPVFSWVDDYANLVNAKYDTQFQATARESLVMTTYIFQSINGLKEGMGASQGEIMAKALMANLGLKVYCANDDADTNQMAAAQIGKKWMDLTSVSVDEDKKKRHSISSHYHFQVEPEQFSRLKTGGRQNNYKVQSVIFKAGKQWADGKNYLEAEFDQIFVL